MPLMILLFITISCKPQNQGASQVKQAGSGLSSYKGLQLVSVERKRDGDCVESRYKPITGGQEFGSRFCYNAKRKRIERKIESKNEDATSLGLADDALPDNLTDYCDSLEGEGAWPVNYNYVSNASLFFRKNGRSTQAMRCKFKKTTSPPKVKTIQIFGPTKNPDNAIIKNARVYDIRATKYFPNLTKVHFSSTRLDGLETFTFPDQVKHITINLAHDDEADVFPEFAVKVASRAPSLEVLYIQSKRKVTRFPDMDFSFLEKLDKLKILVSQFKPISLEPLDGHPSLEYVEFLTDPVVYSKRPEIPDLRSIRYAIDQNAYIHGRDKIKIKVTSFGFEESL